MDEELITPTFDATGYAAVTLEFDQYIRIIHLGSGVFEVDVWDGAAWVNVYTYDE